MKVLVIEPCFVNFGGHNRSFPLCLALSRKNIQVNLLVSSRSRWAIKKTKINENFYQSELPRINMHPYVNGRILRGLLALGAGLVGKYDIIFARVPAQLESNLPAFFLKLLGKKVVLDWDDYWMGSPIFSGHALLKKYIKFCETKAPKFFKNMVVISDFLENKARRWGAKKVLKMINGVLRDEFEIKDVAASYEKLKLDKNKKYLLAIGGTHSRDRTRLLFDLLERLLQLDPAVRLICNFDPPKQIEEQGLAGKVSDNCLKNTIGLGYISHSDLEYCLSICQAAVFLQGETEDELACYPVRIGSYLSREKAIIMNDVGSEAGNTMKKYGCAIISKDLSVLAKKAVAFLNHKQWQKEVEKKTKAAKNDLSWDKQSEKLIEFFKEVIEAKNV